MCGTAMRGAVALPGSKATSRAKGSHRKLGDLVPDRSGVTAAGPHREGEEPKPMMHGHEKSDPAIVAGKQRTKRRDPLRSWWSQGRGPRGMRASKARAGLRTG